MGCMFVGRLLHPHLYGTRAECSDAGGCVYCAQNAPNALGELCTVGSSGPHLLAETLGRLRRLRVKDEGPPDEGVALVEDRVRHPLAERPAVVVLVAAADDALHDAAGLGHAVVIVAIDVALLGAHVEQAEEAPQHLAVGGEQRRDGSR